MHTAPDCGVCPRQGRLRPGCLISLCYHCLTCGSSRLLGTDREGGGGGGGCQVGDEKIVGMVLRGGTEREEEEGLEWKVESGSEGARGGGGGDQRHKMES